MRRLRRGLSLLEILLALVLIVSLGALAVPAVDALLDERSFEAGADVTIEHLRLARSHAQLSGRTVVVRYVEEEKRARLEVRELRDDEQAAAPSGERPLFSRESEFSRDSGGGDEPGVIVAASYGVAFLPRSIRFSVARPAFLNAPGEMLEEPSSRPEAVTLRIAVFLPDGSTLAAGDVWLHDDAERAGAVAIDPFTGLVVFTRVEPSVDSAPPEEDEGFGSAFDDDE